LSYEWPRLELEIDCGGGTYIRSIARDLGEILGCGALMDALVRARIGPFTQEAALNPDELDRDALEDLLLSPLEAVPDLPRITLDDPLVADVALGRKLAADRLDAPVPPGEVALLSPDGDLVAIGEGDPDGLAVQPRKVFI
jgi:tRNA pseudouridine55 synthase